MEWSQTYPSQPDMVATARSVVCAWLAGTPIVETAALIVSELATNALRHGSGDITVTVAHEAGYARVSVTDRGVGEWKPTPTLPTDGNESGRGLWIVSQFADKFGHDRTPDLQTVWAELTWSPEGAS